jgi:hypothetical protein
MRYISKIYSLSFLFILNITFINSGFSQTYPVEQALSSQPIPGLFVLDFGTVTSNSYLGFGAPRGASGTVSTSLGMALGTPYASGSQSVANAGTDLPTGINSGTLSSYDAGSGDVEVYLTSAYTSRLITPMVAVNTLGYKNIKISYDLTHRQKVGSNELNFVLQYRLGTTGSFIDIDNSAYSTSGKAANETTVFANLTLTGSADNQPIIQIRWVPFTDILATTAAGSENDFNTVGIDNITVQGILLVPAPQSIPFSLDFNTPTGFFPTPTAAGVLLSRSNSNVFTYAAASAGAGTNIGSAGATIVDSTSLVNNTTTSSGTSYQIISSSGSNQKFGFNLFSRAISVLTSLNTTGKTNLALSYDVTQMETSSDITDKGVLLVEYRIGESGAFTSITGTYYETEGKTRGTNTKFMNVLLPTDTYDKNLVQIRFLAFPLKAISNYITPAIDNISVIEYKDPVSLSISSIEPSSPTEGFDFSLVVKTLNAIGAPTTVSSPVVFSITSPGNGFTAPASTFTITSGMSSITLNGFSFSSFQNTSITAAYISGLALSNSPSQAIQILSFSGATKLEIASVTASAATITNEGQTFTVVINSLTSDNQTGVVSSATGISLQLVSGTGSLSGIMTGTIPAGQSSVTISGLTYSKIEENVSIRAVATSGNTLSASTSSTGFNVGNLAKSVSISKVIPEAGALIGKGITINVSLKGTNALDAALNSDLTLTATLSQGTGTLGGTLTGVILAGQKSGSIQGITYDKAETIKITVAASGFTSVITDTIRVFADPTAGLQVLYRQDFENTNKAVLGPNGNFPAIPSDMKIYNLDGQTSTEYPLYGTDGFVMLRRSGRGVAPFATDDIAQYGTKLYFFDNSNSTNPDSNYIAAATSFFSLTQTVGADRWIVTPAISLAGENLKFSLQAMSGTSSGNYEDLMQVLFSTEAPGTTLNPANWEAFTMKNLVLGTDSATNSAPTFPNTYSVSLPSTFNNQVVYFAVRLKTGQVFGSDWGGDRLFIDNLLVTSGGTTTTGIKSSFENSKLGIYPNPGKDQITLSFNLKENSNVKLVLTDYLGSEVLSSSLGSLSYGPQFMKVGLPNLLPGVYFVKLVSGSQVITSKLIIE